MKHTHGLGEHDWMGSPWRLHYIRNRQCFLSDCPRLLTPVILVTPQIRIPEYGDSDSRSSIYGLSSIEYI